MKFFKQKKIQDLQFKIDYYEWHKCSVYKLDFNFDDKSDWLLFNTQEDMKNYIIYHQIKDYTWELVEVISNNLRFGDEL